MRELKQCIYCQGDAGKFSSVSLDSIYDVSYAVYCKNCFAITPFCNTKEQAFEEWNNGNANVPIIGVDLSNDDRF